LGGCWRGCIWKRGILDALAISRDNSVVWGILWTIGHGMLIFMKGILDIARYRKVHMFVFIIPFQSNAMVEATSPIFSNGVVRFQSINDMLGMFFSHILDTKIIHNKGELDGARGMAP
jgi:hypothetical protein